MLSVRAGPPTRILIAYYMENDVINPNEAFHYYYSIICEPQDRHGFTMRFSVYFTLLRAQYIVSHRNFYVNQCFYSEK